MESKSAEEIKHGDWVYSEEPVFGSGGRGNVVFIFDERINYSTDFGHQEKFIKIDATAIINRIDQEKSTALERGFNAALDVIGAECEEDFDLTISLAIWMIIEKHRP